MILIFTGNGKGKTTAALGYALRAIGDHKKIVMIQFIKGPWISGEDSSHKKLAPYFSIVKKGKGFVGIGNDTLPFATHVAAAHNGLAYARMCALTRQWDTIILDEIWNALDLGLLSQDDIHHALDIIIPRTGNVILTGRNCPPLFMEKADLVTEMKEIKHPFSKGIAGSKGIEF